MQRRKLEELNLLDDFLFGSVVSYPGIGEKFVRLLLEIIFKKEFGDLTVVPQKVYFGSDTDKHGARLDVYLEEHMIQVKKNENTTVYDVEPDENNATAVKEALPKRVRFYHAKLDGQSLESGVEYDRLKDVIVIMITSYDPFGLNRMVYTVQNGCKEVPHMSYNDGAMTLFLYTKGEEEKPDKELRQLLAYMEHTTIENAKNEKLKIIHQMVNIVKRDGKVSIKYMKVLEQRAMWMEEGRKEGREEGRKEERANTEREKQRAELAEQELSRLREENKRLKAASFK